MISETNEKESNHSDDTSFIHRVRYASWGEFINHVENGKSPLSDSQRASRNPSMSFNGVESFKAAVKLGKEGWLDGEVKANELSAPIIDEISQLIERQEYIHDVEGSGIDVARYVDGEPECFTRFDTRIENGTFGTRLIRIIFNCSASSSVDKEIITAKGATVASLVEVLELAGNRCEVVVVEACSRLGIYEGYIPVKNYDQPLDMAQLMFALAHPAMLRVMMFSVEECLTKELIDRFGFKSSQSYGTPCEIFQKSDRGDIYIGSSMSGDPQWQNKESATNWVLGQLKKQGVALKEVQNVG